MTYERLAILSAAGVYDGDHPSCAELVWRGAVNHVQFDMLYYADLDALVLAFAGSNERRDWMRHLLVRRARLDGAGMVHRGWLADWRMVAGTVSALVGRYHTGGSLILCGHSYGGALAQLAAWHLPQTMDSVDAGACMVYTFGCPRVGNKRFACSMDAVVNHHYRYTVNGDPVPHLPLGIRYKHAGRHVKFPYKPCAHRVQNYQEALLP